jgi:hypothetical protein
MTKYIWHGPYYRSSSGPSESGPTYAINRVKSGGRNWWSAVDVSITVEGRGARTFACRIAKLLKEEKL